jgi:hypothetical protein
MFNVVLKVRYMSSPMYRYIYLLFRFVRDLIYDPPSLLELAGRVVKVKDVPYSPQDLPMSLVQYLDSAHHCVNPRCRGMLFQYSITSNMYRHVE